MTDTERSAAGGDTDQARRWVESPGGLRWEDSPHWHGHLTAWSLADSWNIGGMDRDSGPAGRAFAALVALVRDHAAVTQERDALRQKVDDQYTRWLACEDENARLWEFVRAYDALHRGVPSARLNGLDAARAALGDTP